MNNNNKPTILDDITSFLVARKVMVNKEPSYGSIGISQNKQFALISKNGIPITTYRCKADLEHNYYVWTFECKLEAQEVYNALISKFKPGLKESHLTRKNQLEEGITYIYTI